MCVQRRGRGGVPHAEARGRGVSGEKMVSACSRGKSAGSGYGWDGMAWHGMAAVSRGLFLPQGRWARHVKAVSLGSRFAGDPDSRPAPAHVRLWLNHMGG